ncbi:MAG TPA: polysaccharide deacetylase family protein [Solirubrobacterales bacterium]|nr:polysaccharide deacetylase family protein [Solirubrobacterales bacterium]
MGDRLLRNRAARVTFLCYHSVAAEGPRYLTVSADLFERQLACLRRSGIRSGNLRSLSEAADGGLDAATAFLTFDDGFRDNFETVLPLLREYGFGAFVFVLPPLVDCGGPLGWSEVAADLNRHPSTMRSVTWEMIEEMKEGGFEVGSHTLTHPHLSQLDDEALREELWESRARIKDRLGACDTLAYPFGDWSGRVAAAAAECGYSYAFSLPTKTGQRRATPHSIPRINVDYRDGERRFEAKLSAYGKRVILSPAMAAIRRRLPH